MLPASTAHHTLVASLHCLPPLGPPPPPRPHPTVPHEPQQPQDPKIGDTRCPPPSPAPDAAPPTALHHAHSPRLSLISTTCAKPWPEQVGPRAWDHAICPTDRPIHSLNLLSPIGCFALLTLACYSFDDPPRPVPSFSLLSDSLYLSTQT
jgi:hypothetical protein